MLSQLITRQGEVDLLILVSPDDRLQVPERVSAALVDEVLLDDGVGGDPVGSIARGKGTSLEYHDKVGNMQISYQETFIRRENLEEKRECRALESLSSAHYIVCVQLTDHEIVIHHLRQGGEEGAELGSRPEGWKN